MERSLGEKLVLLAFDPEKGKPVAQPAIALPYALAGAALMDLLLHHGARLVDGTVQAGPDTGDPVLDDVQSRIRAETKPRNLKHWVKKLAGRSAGLQGHLLARLETQGTLQERDGSVLGFKVKRHTLSDRSARDQIVSAVRNALVSDAPVDAAMASLVSLAASAGLVDRVVTKDERSVARRRAKTLAQGDPSGEAVRSAVQEVEAAVMAGTIAALAASSVTSSGHGH